MLQALRCSINTCMNSEEPDDKDRSMSQSKENVTGAKPKKKRSQRPKEASADSSHDTDLPQINSAYSNVNMQTLIGLLDKIEKDKDEKLQEDIQARLERIYFKSQREIRDGLKSCEHLLSEHLEDYIVLGHTYDGQRVKMTKARNKKDEDSLREALRDYFFTLNGPEMY